MDIIEVLRDVIFYLGLMTPDCFESLVVDLNVSDAACIKSAVSKTLGLGIVVGSSLVKLPQVLKIAGSGSAEGISFTSVLLELVAITFGGAYSFLNKFPFSSYGESVFLAVQTGVIALLVLSFSKGKFQALLFGALYSGAVYLLTTPGVIPAATLAQILWYGQAANIPMIILGKMIQIITNFKNGHTGQLSAVTSFLLSLGAIARIFTSIQETGDNVIILTYVCSSVVNTIIALQVILYWNTSPAKKQKTQ